MNTGVSPRLPKIDGTWHRGCSRSTCHQKGGRVVGTSKSQERPKMSESSTRRSCARTPRSIAALAFAALLFVEARGLARASELRPSKETSPGVIWVSVCRRESPSPSIGTEAFPPILFIALSVGSQSPQAGVASGPCHTFVLRPDLDRPRVDVIPADAAVWSRGRPTSTANSERP